MTNVTNYDFKRGDLELRGNVLAAYEKGFGHIDDLSDTLNLLSQKQDQYLWNALCSQIGIYPSHCQHTPCRLQFLHHDNLDHHVHEFLTNWHNEYQISKYDPTTRNHRLRSLGIRVQCEILPKKLYSSDPNVIEALELLNLNRVLPKVEYSCVAFPKEPTESIHGFFINERGHIDWSFLHSNDDTTTEPRKSLVTSIYERFPNMFLEYPGLTNCDPENFNLQDFFNEDGSSNIGHDQEHNKSYTWKVQKFSIYDRTKMKLDKKSPLETKEVKCRKIKGISKKERIERLEERKHRGRPRKDGLTYHLPRRIRIFISKWVTKIGHGIIPNYGIFSIKLDLVDMPEKLITYDPYLIDTLIPLGLTKFCPPIELQYNPNYKYPKKYITGFNIDKQVFISFISHDVK